MTENTQTREVQQCVPWSPPTYEESCNPTPIPPATAGASSWNRYDAPRSIFFEILADPRLAKREQAWFGWLSVKTENVPQMMKEGFVISPETILHEEGCVKFTKDAPEGWMQEKWPYTRHWYLRDTAKQDDERGGPRWMAHLSCLAANFETLARIRPCDLTHHQVDNCTAAAGSETGPRIYHYDRKRPRESINCIYDDLPLEGLWPYPRSSENREEDARQELQGFSSQMRELIKEADRNARQLRDSTQ
ncbi:hypothetical protein PG985_009569 [Apiospora marii]|uniref:Uncharacterized protein n=1 Tax=Apiospora marii TaxID=335849 RepID=A0ABR1RFQ9_9PEZI